MIQQTFNPPAGDHLSPRRPANWATWDIRDGLLLTGVSLSLSKDGGKTWEGIDLTPSPESLENWGKAIEIPITDVTVSPVGPASHYLTKH